MAVLQALSLVVLTLPSIFIFLLSFKKSICFQHVFSSWNHSPLWKSIWVSGCLYAGSWRGSCITGVIDLGCVPFPELQSTSAIWLSDDEYMAHLLVCILFHRKTNMWMKILLLEKSNLEDYFLKCMFRTMFVWKHRNIHSNEWKNP